MYRHGPSCLEGPVTGTREWWSPADEDPALPGTSSMVWEGNRTDQSNIDPIAEEQPIRTELVERVRREIALGIYDTPEKWQAALNRLFDELADQ
jgi:hypothetical protein